MPSTFASLLLIWAVFGGPICGEICAQLDAQAVAQLPPCHAPGPSEEAPADSERCCEDPDVFAAMSPVDSDGDLGATLRPFSVYLLPGVDVRTARVLAHPPDPLARPFARTHRPLLI